MGQRCTFDAVTLASLIQRQHGVVSREQGLRCAMSEPAIRHRIRPDGPWLVVLPGVYLTSRGSVTLPQRAVAALLYAGPGTAVSGPAALAWHGIRPYAGDSIDVQVKPNRRKRSVDFARLHRTGIATSVAFRDGGLVYAPPTREDFLGSQDAWWPGAGVAGEVPGRIRRAPGEVAAEIRAAVVAGGGRQLPLLRMLPAR